MNQLDPDWPVFEFRPFEDKWELLYEGEPKLDRDGREYQMVGQFLEDEDFYQGLNMITVIRRVSDDKEFGYSWWNDISKHGESYVDSNGEEYGLECDTDVEGFDWDTDYISYYVFVPVEQAPIISYVKKD